MDELEERTVKFYEPYTKVMTYVKTALRVLRHHDYLCVSYDGDGNLSVSSNKRFSMKMDNFNDYLAAEVYMDLISLGFERTAFSENLYAYELKYSRK